MPQMVEIPGLSKADATLRAQDFGIDGVPVEIIPQSDGKFTVRATYPDDMELPGAKPLPPQPPEPAPQPQQTNTQPQQANTQPQQTNTQPQQANTQPQQANTQPQQANTQPQQTNTQPQQGGTQPQQANTQPQQTGSQGQQAAALKLSNKGAGLVKAFESCLHPVSGSYRAYFDPVKVLTIGWGHTNHNGRQITLSSVWTRAECDAEFLADMAIFEKAVSRNVKVKLTQDQFDALVSFTFNVGEGNLQHSTLLQKVNAGDFAGAAREFSKWNKAGGKVLPGLTRRRASEALLFQSIPDSNYDGVPD